LKIEGINIEKALAVSGGSMENYVRTLGVFFKDGLHKLEEIRNSHETKNLPLYIIFVHALKSASANIGAGGLSEMAKALEEAGQRDDTAYIDEHNAVFLSEYGALLNNISRALANTSKDTREGSVDMELLKLELTEAKAAVKAFDAAATQKAAAGLHKFTYNAGIGPKVEAILENILIGDDEKAVELIDSLL
jgi:HPt (histidine-containing phosphotransfer) domain-containing protein